MNSLRKIKTFAKRELNFLKDNVQCCQISTENHIYFALNFVQIILYSCPIFLDTAVFRFSVEGNVLSSYLFVTVFFALDTYKLTTDSTFFFFL